VLESVKRDLGELTTIVTTETSNIVLNTTNVVKDTLQVCKFITYILYIFNDINQKYLILFLHVLVGKSRVYCQHYEEIS